MLTICSWKDKESESEASCEEKRAGTYMLDAEDVVVNIDRDILPEPQRASGNVGHAEKSEIEADDLYDLSDLGCVHMDLAGAADDLVLAVYCDGCAVLDRGVCKDLSVEVLAGVQE